jgi:hypothetical protein
MARRVYFGFHYEDVTSFRANVVRNSWVTKSDDDDSVFFDASLWEKAKKLGFKSIKAKIDSGLNNTSITAILIGQYTYLRPWVRYEIAKSFERGNGLLGIYIHGIPDKMNMICIKGKNPFAFLALGRIGGSITGTTNISAAPNPMQPPIIGPVSLSQVLNPPIKPKLYGPSLGQLLGIPSKKESTSRQSRLCLMREWKNGKWCNYSLLPFIKTASLNYDFMKNLEGQLSKHFKIYDWQIDKGYDNFHKWLEVAARQAGRI